jgi:hypothetical protein
MTKKINAKSKAIKKKAVREVERKVARKARPQRAPAKAANYNYKEPNFRQLNSSAKASPAHVDPKRLAQDYVYCLLNPWDGMVRQLNPVVPDGSMVQTTTFWTKTVVSSAVYLNAATGTYDFQLTLFPFGFNHIQIGTVYTGGGPSTLSFTNATNYSTWGTNFEAVRCVAMGAQIRNTQAAGSESGVAIQYRAPANLTYNVNTNGFSLFANQGDAVLRGTSKPGDMGLMHWRPNGTAATGDTQFKAYNANAGSYLTLGTGATSVTCWVQTNSSATFEATVYAAWEAKVLPGAAGLFDTQTNCSDRSVANNMLMRALEKCPDYCQDRVVATDDGVIDSIVKDAKSIYGGVQSVINVGKTIGGIIGDIFGFLSPHRKLGRVLHHLVEEPDTFDILVQWVRNTPNATLADCLAYFYDEQQDAYGEMKEDYLTVTSPRRHRVLPPCLSRPPSPAASLRASSLTRQSTQK